MGKLSNAMENLVDAIQSSSHARHTGLNDIRIHVHEALERYRSQRHDMAEGTRESVQKHVEQIRQTVGNLRLSTRARLGEIAWDVRDATRLWGKGPEGRVVRPQVAVKLKVEQKPLPVGKKPVQAPGGRVAEAMAGPPRPTAAAVGDEAGKIPFPAPQLGHPPSAAVDTEQEKKPLNEQDRVLQVIEAHPDGIRLVDIGNQLGVDWRGLIGTTKSLLDGGKIEKIDYLYYPVGD
jgi:hypothetical protein